MVEEIHLGDIGTEFRVTVRDGTTPVDLSSSVIRQLRFQKPSGALLTKSASLFTDGTDGIIYYVSQSGDLDEVGRWKLQAFVTVGTKEHSSNIERFTVHRNLEECD